MGTKASLRRAQGDNDSERKKVISYTIITAKLFQIIIFVVDRQNDNKAVKTACHPDPSLS
jgi:hypothetical protein